jgi:hypothetical protein
MRWYLLLRFAISYRDLEAMLAACQWVPEGPTQLAVVAARLRCQGVVLIPLLAPLGVIPSRRVPSAKPTAQGGGRGHQQG